MIKQINASGIHYRELNRRINSLIAEGCQELVLDNVNGQRYIGDAVETDLKITINGLPGNDLGVFMDGPQITVNANIQDGAANTMNSGSIIVHGDAGDVLGYGMRGGEVYIAGNAGYRAGIHMKAYQENCPTMVIGGKTGDFLGEYMAGGLILVLNLKNEEFATGDYCGSGMHGGMIVIRGKAEKHKEKVKASIVQLDSSDFALIGTHLTRYEKLFSRSIGEMREEEYFKVVCENSRPYQGLYIGI